MRCLARIAGEELQAMAKLVKYFCRLFFKNNFIAAAFFFFLRGICAHNSEMAMCVC